mmetsp:Transcript_18821/g.24596  ORF Transcript_18821/g.24596 Transcript_18821/m.24596 type:complete len:80 (-) Transcript_18821:243-482(-)
MASSRPQLLKAYYSLVLVGIYLCCCQQVQGTDSAGQTLSLDNSAEPHLAWVWTGGLAATEIRVKVALIIFFNLNYILSK